MLPACASMYFTCMSSKYDSRDALALYLSSHGIQTVISYPTALPFLPAYDRLHHLPGDFPNAFRHQTRVQSLPIYPELSASQIEYLGETLSSFARSHIQAAREQ